MKKNIYPSYGDAIVLLLLMLVFTLAGLPGYVPYLIWKNELTHTIGLISLYIAASVLTIRYAGKRIKETGEPFSVRSFFSRKMKTCSILILIPTTFSGTLCISYVVGLLNLKDWTEDPINDMMKIPVLSFFSLAIMPAFLEEFIFRGILLKQFLKRYSVIASILVSAALFGLIHGNPVQVVQTFAAGCFLGWVYYKTGNLTYCILIHFVNNALAWLGLELINRFPENAVAKYLNNPDIGLLDFMIALIISIIGIYLFHKQYESGIRGTGVSPMVQ